MDIAHRRDGVVERVADVRVARNVIGCECGRDHLVRTGRAKRPRWRLVHSTGGLLAEELGHDRWFPPESRDPGGLLLDAHDSRHQMTNIHARAGTPGAA